MEKSTPQLKVRIKISWGLERGFLSSDLKIGWDMHSWKRAGRFVGMLPDWEECWSLIWAWCIQNTRKWGRYVDYQRWKLEPPRSTFRTHQRKTCHKNLRKPHSRESAKLFDLATLFFAFALIFAILGHGDIEINKFTGIFGDVQLFKKMTVGTEDKACKDNDEGMSIWGWGRVRLVTSWWPFSLATLKVSDDLWSWGPTRRSFLNALEKTLCKFKVIMLDSLRKI